MNLNSDRKVRVFFIPIYFISYKTPNDMKKYAIIVAGGKGNRMGETTPKQFLLLAGKPILMRTIEAFYTASSQIELIVVLPSKDV